MDRFSGATGLLFVLGMATLVAAVLIVVVWQVAKTVRARQAVSREITYKQVAEQATEAMRSMSAMLADMQPRLAAIEKMMRDVG
jgi:hypothetical protein